MMNTKPNTSIIPTLRQPFFVKYAAGGKELLQTSEKN